MPLRQFHTLVCLLIATLGVPGLVQAADQGNPAPPPRFSHRSGTFTEPFPLVLTPPFPGAAIRYTTNGTLPSETSFLYQEGEPIRIETSRQIRARTFAEGWAPSETVTVAFVQLDPEVADDTSNLPLVVLENFRRGAVPANNWQPAYLMLFEPHEGRSRLLQPPNVSTRAGIRIRGSSTQDQPKRNYAVELWNEADEDVDLPLLGMPADSDWILYAPYNFDRALIRNAFMYALSNQAGRYAVRTRFVEVYANTGGGPVAPIDYMGVYVLMERIKRGDDRVDVERLLPEHTSEPWITGGYMLKIDRLDPGDRGLSAGGQTLGWVYPEEDEVVPAQVTWVRNYFNEFWRTLRSTNSADPVIGYSAYIDVDSWIDHHILNEFSKNPDGLRLSTYMFKRRNQKLEMGPIWDFDRTMGPDDDGRAANPVGWSDVFNYGWWSSLFRDPDFWMRYIDRWHELRQDVLSVENMHALIDSLALPLEEAQVRNFERWRLLRANGWQVEINQLKQWVARRVVWIDSQFVAPPEFSRPGGVIQPGFKLGVTAPQGTIYYTLDGTDPRLPGGDISPTAIALPASGGEIVLNGAGAVLARAYVPRPRNPWSALSKAVFSSDQMPWIALTEIMYHPMAPSDGSSFDKDQFEYLELQNLGAYPVDLAGYRFVEGVRFEFPPLVLGPGESLLIVKDRAAFAWRYPDSTAVIAGEYEGQLDNSGERISLVDPVGRPVLQVDYSDDGPWDSLADGRGSSLEAINPVANLNSASNWRAAAGGSPGKTPWSRLEIVRTQDPRGSVRLRFRAEPGKSYTIWFRDGFASAAWQRLSPIHSVRDGDKVEVWDEPAGAVRFYRITGP